MVVLGTGLIVVDRPVVTDYYFPIAWYGYILVLDGWLGRMGRLGMTAAPGVFLLMIPVSSAFWWVFELINQATGNWQYTGAGAFTGIRYVLFASMCFSTVLLAVWETALCLDSALRGGTSRNEEPAAQDHYQRSPASLLSNALNPVDAATAKLRFGVSLPVGLGMAAGFGVACIILPTLFPRYAFPLIWGALFFLLDPVNYWLGRSSLLAQMWAGRFRTPITFGLASLVCGFFWEGWNYWAPIKWVYHVPYVSQLHLFEMPLPGYAGYLPFGLELYAMTVFVIPFLLATILWVSPKRDRLRFATPREGSSVRGGPSLTP